MCCLLKMGTMRKASEHSAQLGLKEQSLSGLIWETHTQCTHTHKHAGSHKNHWRNGTDPRESGVWRSNIEDRKRIEVQRVDIAVLIMKEEHSKLQLYSTFICSLVFFIPFPWNVTVKLCFSPKNYRYQVYCKKGAKNLNHKSKWCHVETVWTTKKHMEPFFLLQICVKRWCNAPKTQS